LGKVLTISHFFRLILEEMDDAALLRTGAIAVVNSAGKTTLKAQHVSRRHPGREPQAASFLKVAERVIRTGRPELAAAGGAEAGAPDGCVVAVPIRSQSRAIGCLVLERDGGAEAGTELLPLMGVVAAVLSHTIQFNRLIMREDHQAAADWADIKPATSERFRPINIIGTSGAMQAVYDLVRQVSAGNAAATVLISGESGVGKELVGNAIHMNGPRAKKPFIKVNCAALPETLLESELFGHERGAFTGAFQQKKGRFELADGGTIFLDEIGELSLSMQVKLLRVLQEREFERIGGVVTLKTDVQVIAATNRNLEDMIGQNLFRQDLYYRLNVFPIHVPALRDRRTDILLLADSFVEKYSRRLGKPILRISTPAIDMLMAYHWPGNVRELENVIERSVLLSTDRVIHSHHLPPSLQTAEASGTRHVGSLKGTISALERETILDALKTSRGNMAKAARELGLSERVMGLRVRRYGIDPRRFRT
jgi:Nif-specific regulatory protein